MTGILDTTISGLRAYQTALTTTSHNISNVGTEGYSRQSVQLDSREPQSFGSINIGQGVEATEIYRVLDEFVNGNIREFQSVYSRLDMFENFASRVENLIADDQGSIMPALNDFFSALSDVANDPSAYAPRVALIGAAENLEQRFLSLSNEMQDIEEEVDKRIISTVSDINALTSEIARVNDSITSNSTVENQPADLLDKRDLLLKQLSEKISISVVEQADGTLNVLAGSGQLLVTGPISVNLVAQPDFVQPDRLGVAIQSGAGTIEVTRTLSGGELGGLLDFRNTLLDSAQNQLGRTAIALSETFNNQHREGYDLNGNLGTDFFSIGSSQALGNLNNAVTTAAVNVTVDDATLLTPSDYTVTFTTVNSYDIVRLSDNTSVSTGVFIIDPTVVNVDGLDFSLSGAPAAGDSFYVRPTRTAATAFQTLITDPNAIAVASPIRTTTAVANIGDTSISTGNIVDVADPDLLRTVDIYFDPATPGTFDVIDRLSAAVLQDDVVYVPGMTVLQNGWEVQLNGEPVVGDMVTVQQNTGAATDNRNALALNAIRTLGIMDGGSISLEQSYSALTADVGTITQQVIINKDVEGSLLDAAKQERESISGVNLDEEAGNLIRFQQAYQALSRVIQTAQSIFQSLLEAV